MSENGKARTCPADLVGDGLGWLYRHLFCTRRGKTLCRNWGRQLSKEVQIYFNIKMIIFILSEEGCVLLRFSFS